MNLLWNGLALMTAGYVLLSAVIMSAFLLYFTYIDFVDGDHGKTMLHPLVIAVAILLLVPVVNVFIWIYLAKVILVKRKTTT
jgi:hypothetical protein